MAILSNRAHRIALKSRSEEHTWPTALRPRRAMASGGLLPPVGRQADEGFSPVGDLIGIDGAS